MSSETDKTDLLVEHIEDSRRMGLDVKPPDVNESGRDFAVAGNVLRFGLLAIKGVGEKAVDALVAERQARGRFRDLFDLCERVDGKLVPKATLEALFKAGAGDSLGGRRRQLCEGLDAAFQAGAKARAAREAGQGSLFGGADDADFASAAAAALPNVPEWSDQEKLGYEKALLGVYLSSHPLREHERTLRLFRSHAVAELAALPPKTPVVLGGMIQDLRKLTTKKGKNVNQSYARFALADLTGTAACVMFADGYALWGDRLAADAVVFLRGEIDTPFGGAAAPAPDQGDAPRPPVQILAGEVIHLAQAPAVLSGNLVVRIDGARTAERDLESLQRVLAARPGNSPVHLEIHTADGLRARMRAGPQTQVQCDDDLAAQIEALFGPGSARLAPNAMPRRDQRRPA
jgi:DNA polymerase-3 subunit alpha